MTNTAVFDAVHPLPALMAPSFNPYSLKELKSQFTQFNRLQHRLNIID